MTIERVGVWAVTMAIATGGACASHPPTPTTTGGGDAAPWVGAWQSDHLTWQASCDDPSYDAAGEDAARLVVDSMVGGLFDIYAANVADPAQDEEDQADDPTRWTCALEGRVARVVETVDQGDPNAFWAHDDVRLDMERDGSFTLTESGAIDADWHITYRTSDTRCRERVRGTFERVTDR